MAWKDMEVQKVYKEYDLETEKGWGYQLGAVNLIIFSVWIVKEYNFLKVNRYFYLFEIMIVDVHTITF